MHTDEMKFGRLSERIIGCAITVANTLGGSSRKCTKMHWRMSCVRQDSRLSNNVASPFGTNGVIVGEHTIDLLVDHSVVVELKAVRMLDDIHRAQCLNYLKATGLQLCLLINFGNPRLEIKRLVL
jgi:GxxExxY protein